MTLREYPAPPDTGQRLTGEDMTEHRGGHPDCAECADVRLAERNREPDRQWPDPFKPPRYKWTETGMVLDSRGSYVLAHMVPAVYDSPEKP